MDTQKIGKFIAKCRKDNKLTQEQLAEKLNVSSKAVSKWETGNGMPDSSIMLDLSNILGITVNELLSGEKIDDINFKKVADKNLIDALESNPFALNDKILYYKNKWKKEHIFTIVLSTILWLTICTILKLKNVDGRIIGAIGGLLSVLLYIVIYNRMMTYVENNAYKKIEK